MVEYSFTTSFQINAPVTSVWKILLDFPEWKTWWRGVRSMKIDTRKVPPILHVKIGFPFYTLALTLQIKNIETGKLIAFTTTGDLIGNGMLFLHTKGAATEIIFDWNVATPKLWMNIVGSIAKPIFDFSHNLVMRWFVSGLAEKLGTTVTHVMYTVNKTPPTRLTIPTVDKH